MADQLALDGFKDPSAQPVAEDEPGIPEGSRVVRVLADVSGIDDKHFDYLAPPAWADQVRVGSMVRMDLHGRRVAGWIVAVDVEPPEGVRLRTLTRLSGVGPPAAVIDLAAWTAHRWVGRHRAVLRSASPSTMVPAWPAPPRRAPELRPITTDDTVAAVLGAPGTHVVRRAPAADHTEMISTVARHGTVLVITPNVVDAGHLAGRLRRLGHRVHRHPKAWAGGASGGIVVGTRSAVWAPVGGLAAIVVLDEHDEALGEERNPTWNARDVAVERARRNGVPCLLVSAVPSVAALAVADSVLDEGRSLERSGWPRVIVADRRTEDPARAGLFSPALVDAIRSGGRVLAVLNRTGRATMLSCRSCGELVRTEDGEHLMTEVEGRLVATATGEERPLVCAVCAGTTLKRLRLGTSRAAEELAALAGEPVAEVTGAGGLPDTRIVLGTEAVLHRANDADVVAFLDLDAELLAPRYRAAEQALALIARAARLTGARAPGDEGGRLVLQTRMPEHRVVRAALLADPAGFAEAEGAIRNAAQLPPAAALAVISGAGAPELATSLREVEARVVGPDDDGRYRISCPTWDELADRFDLVDRPAERVRIQVDPSRV